MIISAIVPFYNNHETIGECLRSIQNNKLIDEIIVVDDGSESPFILKNSNYNAKIRVIRQKNMGVSAARNIGARIAKNDWIAFCDADDQWNCGKLLAQSSLVKMCGFDIVGTLRDTSNKKCRGRLYFIDLLYLLLQWDPHISTVVIKRKLFFEAGGFDEKLRRGEDCEFYVRVIQLVGAIPVIPESFVKQIRAKASYGEAGLSADLRKMYIGEKLILSRAIKNNNLSGLKKLFEIYYYARYLRRVILTYKRKNG